MAHWHPLNDRSIPRHYGSFRWVILVRGRRWNDLRRLHTTSCVWSILVTIGDSRAIHVGDSSVIQRQSWFNNWKQTWIVQNSESSNRDSLGDSHPLAKSYIYYFKYYITRNRTFLEIDFWIALENLTVRVTWRFWAIHRWFSLIGPESWLNPRANHPWIADIRKIQGPLTLLNHCLITPYFTYCENKEI
jgi:hypothetical protein